MEECVKHCVVFSKEKRFGGWPANHGLWRWGNEVVVGFQSCVFKVIDDGNHAIDKSQPREHLQARSVDGGESWTIENGVNVDSDSTAQDIQELSQINYEDENLAITFLEHKEKPGVINQYISLDKCKTWKGPYQIRIFEDRKIEPRTDYIVLNNESVIAWFTGFKDNGEEGNIFCAQFKEGRWEFLSWLDKEKEGFTIMPSTIRLSSDTFLTASRWQRNGRWGIDTYVSNDGGNHWELHSHVIENEGLSNPPSMIKLHDGRLCITYGTRVRPFGINAVFSSDEGLSWSDPKVLRDDGGHWDLGYTRSTQLTNGNVLTAYYFCHDKLKERTIEATIWRP